MAVPIFFHSFFHQLEYRESPQHRTCINANDPKHLSEAKKKKEIHIYISRWREPTYPRWPPSLPTFKTTLPQIHFRILLAALSAHLSDLATLLFFRLSLSTYFQSFSINLDILLLSICIDYAHCIGIQIQ